MIALTEEATDPRLEKEKAILGNHKSAVSNNTKISSRNLKESKICGLTQLLEEPVANQTAGRLTCPRILSQSNQMLGKALTLTMETLNKVLHSKLSRR